MAVVMATGALFTGTAQAAPDAPLANTCKSINGTLVVPCYGADVVVRDVSSLCRWADATPDETCAMPIEPKVSESLVQSYESSWTHRALGLQYALANDMPLRNAPWVGTHNSFNSIAEMGPTLSDTDSNQELSLTDQLRLDVRSLELDLHWFPSVSDLLFAPVVCHAQSRHEGARSRSRSARSSARSQRGCARIATRSSSSTSRTTSPPASATATRTRRPWRGSPRPSARSSTGRAARDAPSFRST